MLSSEGFQLRKQLILAMEAAVLVILDVVGVLELVGIDVLVLEAAGESKSLRVALMGFGDRRGIGGDGDGCVTQYPVRCPGKIGGVSAAGVGDDHPPQIAQQRKKLLLFGVEFRGIQLGRLGLERDESRHTRSIARAERQKVRWTDIAVSK